MILNSLFDVGRFRSELIAHSFEGLETSYLELYKKVTSLVDVIQCWDTPVIVFGHKSSDMIASFLACLYKGIPFIPVDESVPEERIKKIINVSGAGFILNCSSREVVFSHSSIKVSQLKESESTLKPVKLDKTDVAYIVFTSGSTGDPKGVEVSVEALDDFTTWICRDGEFFPNQEKVTFVNHALFSFDLSVFEIWASLVSMGKLVSLDHKNNSNTRHNIEILRKTSSNIWISTPSYLKLCLIDWKFTDEFIPDLKTFIFCGEVLPVSVAGELYKRFPNAKVYNLYGPTEATCATTSLLVSAQEVDNEKPLSVGTVKPRTSIFVSDSEGQLIETPEIEGEIVIVGANVAQGYCKRPDLTKKSFFVHEGKRAYRTGDKGYFDEEHRLHILGRIDRQVKIKGNRIELEEIESALLKIVGIQESCCLAVKKDNNEFVIVCALVGSNTMSLEVVIDSLLKVLPSYMIPSEVRMIERFPINERGKIDYKKIEGLFF